MSGHNKWSTIRHKKGAADAKRGKLFTRIIREMAIAAKEGGGDPDANPRLRTAVAAARAANMPSKNIENAIKRGTGEMPGVEYAEAVYEGYGPGGVAFIVRTSTDNTNRTASDVRHAFSKYNGNLGAMGSVSHLFERKGVVEIDAADTTEEALMEAVLEAGAEDIEKDGDTFTVKCEPNDLDAVKEAVEKAGIEIQTAEVRSIPTITTPLEGKEAETCLKLLSHLDDLDDVDEVSANFDIDDELIEKMMA